MDYFNDGFVDNSDAVVIRSLIGRSPVKCKIGYFMQGNLGKHRAGIKPYFMRGIFILADADDSFVPTTLEYFNSRLN